MSKYVLGLVGESNVNRPDPETAFCHIASSMSNNITYAVGVKLL